MSVAPRLTGRKAPDATINVRTHDSEQVRRVTVQDVGGTVQPVPFRKESGAVQFDIPAHTLAAVAELEM